MKKYIYTALFLLLSTKADADWTKIGVFYDIDKNPNLVAYYDKTTRKGNGKIYEALLLWSFETPWMSLDKKKKQFIFYSSAIVHFNVDCSTHKFKISNIKVYDQKMGTGTQLDYVPEDFDEKSGWQEVRDQSLGEANAETICSITQ